MDGHIGFENFTDTCGRGVSVPLNADGHFGLTGWHCVYSVTRDIPDNNTHNSKFRNDINAFRNRCILTN